tara:strand:- start:792 stop:4100 length:3309 start_codon:yes stop_codon:yes gene_type:complete
MDLDAKRFRWDGEITASKFKGDGSGLTGIVANDIGSLVQNYGNDRILTNDGTAYGIVAENDFQFNPTAGLKILDKLNISGTGDLEIRNITASSISASGYLYMKDDDGTTLDVVVRESTGQLRTRPSTDLGFGTVTGTGVANRVTYWSSTTGLTSDDGFTWNATDNDLNVDGNIILGQYLKHDGDTNTFMGFSSTDQIVLATDALSRIHIGSDGDVSIGEGFQTGNATLSVKGDLKVYDTAGNEGIRLLVEDNKEGLAGQHGGDANGINRIQILFDWADDSGNSDKGGIFHEAKSSADEGATLRLSPGNDSQDKDYVSISGHDEDEKIILATSGKAFFSDKVIIGRQGTISSTESNLEASGIGESKGILTLSNVLDDTLPHIKLDTGGTNAKIEGPDNQSIIFTIKDNGSADDLVVRNNDSDEILIVKAQNKRVGINESDPSEALEVNGDILVSSDGTNILVLNDEPTSDPDKGHIEFLGADFLITSKGNIQFQLDSDDNNTSINNTFDIRRQGEGYDEGDSMFNFRSDGRLQIYKRDTGATQCGIKFINTLTDAYQGYDGPDIKWYNDTTACWTLGPDNYDNGSSRRQILRLMSHNDGDANQYMQFFALHQTGMMITDGSWYPTMMDTGDIDDLDLGSYNSPTEGYLGGLNSTRQYIHQHGNRYLTYNGTSYGGPSDTWPATSDDPHCVDIHIRKNTAACIVLECDLGGDVGGGDGDEDATPSIIMSSDGGGGKASFSLAARSGYTGHGAKVFGLGSNTLAIGQYYAHTEMHGGIDFFVHPGSDNSGGNTPFVAMKIDPNWGTLVLTADTRHGDEFGGQSESRYNTFFDGGEGAYARLPCNNDNAPDDKTTPPLLVMRMPCQIDEDNEYEAPGIRIFDNDSPNYWEQGYGHSNNFTFCWYNASNDTSYRRGYLDNDYDISNITFTGQHLSKPNNGNTEDYADKIGYIVISSGDYLNVNGNVIDTKVTINEAVPKVDLSNKEKDKRVFGVISEAEDPNNLNREFKSGVWNSVVNKNDDNRLWINSLGEGAIMVSDYSGNLENGDYITTSPIEGIGMKQDDDLLHNYTVAKITQDCDFSSDYSTIVYNGATYKYKLVGCTYHCG